jgi:UDP-glucose 4-epimerase
MQKVLITGVAGFIGAHVARRFLQEGFSVVGIDDLSSGDGNNVPAGLEFIRADLSDAASMDVIPSECSKILHLAGQSSGEISFDDPVADLNKNAVSTLNLIRYAIAHKVERIVYASSMSVYGSVPAQPIAEAHPCRPLSCYGVGKLAAEDYLRVYSAHLPFVALRMFNVYGPGQDMRNLRQGMVSIYLAQALSGGRIEVKGSAQRFRDFIYIDDVVETWWRAANDVNVLGKAINVGTGIKTSVGELLQLICDAVPGSLYFINGGTPGDQSGIYADNSALRSLLGQTDFVDLKTGLRRFVDWANRAYRKG